MLTSSYLAFMEEAGTGRDYDLMDCQTFSKSKIIWGCVSGKSIGIFAKKNVFHLSFYPLIQKRKSVFLLLNMYFVFRLTHHNFLSTHHICSSN